MLILFAIAIVQVSHFHSSGSFGKNKTAGYAACDKPSSNGSCFICDYQLTKDADNSYAIYPINRPAAMHITAAASYIFTSQSIYPVFETRGPPSF